MKNRKQELQDELKKLELEEKQNRAKINTEFALKYKDAKFILEYGKNDIFEWFNVLINKDHEINLTNEYYPIHLKGIGFSISITKYKTDETLYNTVTNLHQIDSISIGFHNEEHYKILTDVEFEVLERRYKKILSNYLEDFQVLRDFVKND